METVTGTAFEAVRQTMQVRLQLLNRRDSLAVPLVHSCVLVCVRVYVCGICRAHIILVAV